LIVTLLGIVSGLFGVANGDFKKIGQPYDSDGNACGIGEFSKHGYLFFNDPKNTDLTKNNICVSSCPKTEKDSLDCKPNTTFTR
jgi:hypothetical protein